MRKVYTAANLQDAHIVLGLLEAAGIEATILNVNAQGGLGEIPFTQTYPELWLKKQRDLQRARRLIDEFERPIRAPSVRCAGCGEDNPGTFEICWNCGRAT